MTKHAYLRLLSLITGLLGLFTGGGCTPKPERTAAGTAARRELRLAYFPNVTHAPALVGVADGTFQKALGGAARLTPKVFLNGPAAMEALLAGGVDVAYVGASPAVNAFLKSCGAVKIVGGAASGGAVLVARAGAGINRPQDLAGKRIGTPQKGGTQDIAARYYVTQTLKQKLTDDGGTTAIIATDATQLAALFQQKSLDAAWVQEPWGSRLIREHGAKMVLDERDAWPNRRYATTVLVARTAFLEQNPDLVQAVLRAHVRLSARITKDPQAAAPLIITEIKRRTTRALAPEVIGESLRRIAFTHETYPETLRAQTDRAFALGFLGRTPPDLTGLIAPDPLHQALAATARSQVAAKEAAK